MRTLLLLLLFISGTYLLCAQYRVIPDRNIYVSDKSDGMPLFGAHVTLICGADTIQGITKRHNTGYTALARMECDKEFKDSVDVRISFMGYKTLEERVSAEMMNWYRYFQLEPDDIMINQIVVTGESIAMIINGDTTVYNAAAFQTLPEDRLGELLKQLPGIQVKEGAIYANGEEIKRVYMDGRNLFGSNTGYSLTDVEASDVKRVKVYEEDNPEAVRIGNTTAQKDKVMNVETHSQRTVIKGGSLTALGGLSLEKDFSDKREFRHTEQLTLYRNTEKGNLRFSGSMAENDGDKEQVSVYSQIQPYQRSDATFTHELRRGDSTRISTSARFFRNRSNSMNETTMDYFPSDDYQRRTHTSFSDNLSKQWNTNIFQNIMLMRRKKVFTSTLTLSVNDADSYGYTSTMQQLNDQTTTTDQSTDNQAKNLAFSARVNFHSALSEKMILQFSGSGNFNRQTSDRWTVDTLASVTGMRLVLNSDASGSRENWDGDVGITRKFGQTTSFGLKYSVSRQYHKSRQIARDYLTDPAGVLDRTSSYNYTINSLWNNISADFSVYKDKLMCYLTLTGSLYEVKLNERLPESNRFPHTFFLFKPTVYFSYGTMQNRLRFSLISNVSPLSTEMLRNSLDISNPLSLRAGNPDLKPENSYTFSLGYSYTHAEKATQISVGVNGGYIFNTIVNRRFLFLEATDLPQYGYTAQPGSELYTQVNVDGSLSWGASVEYEKRIAAIRSTVTASLGYNDRELPYYVADQRKTSHSRDARLGLGIHTGFSRNIKLELHSATTYGFYESNDQKTRHIRETLTAQVEYYFTKKYFVNGSFLCDWYYNNMLPERTQHNLIANAAAGRKFGKENEYSLSAGVVDLFNRTSTIFTTLSDDYISTSISSYLGRYGYIRFAYTF